MFRQCCTLKIGVMFLFIVLLLVALFSGCSLTDSTPPIALSTPIFTATATPTPIRATTSPIQPAPTPTALAVLTDVPTAPLSTATASSTPSATPLSSQGDTLPQTSQSDTVSLLTPILTVHDSGQQISCTVASNAFISLHEGPGFEYAQISSLAAGEQLSARKCSPGAAWLLVETTAQQIGWVNTAHLTCQRDPTTLPVASGITPANFGVSEVLPTPTAAPQPTATPTSSATGQSIAAPQVGPPTEAWQAEYFANASLLGEPVVIRQDPELDFNWILNSPEAGLPADNFSVRWTRQLDFIESGDYRFFADADDGVRVYIDGWLVIDAWHTDRPIIHSGNFASIEKGLHTVVVEYFESGGQARIKVWAERTTLTGSGWQAEYYDNPDWRDPAVLVRQDEALDFNWENGAPIGGTDGNNYSVRWQRTLYFDQGDYRFYADIADRDRVRIFLDGWLLVDDYRDSSGRVEGRFNNVGAGPHTVTVEYQEDVGQAKIRVSWGRD